MKRAFFGKSKTQKTRARGESATTDAREPQESEKRTRKDAPAVTCPECGKRFGIKPGADPARVVCPSCFANVPGKAKRATDVGKQSNAPTVEDLCATLSDLVERMERIETQISHINARTMRMNQLQDPDQFSTVDPNRKRRPNSYDLIYQIHCMLREITTKK